MIEISLRNGRALKAPADMDRRLLASLIACVEAA
jgi:transposase